MNTIFRGIKPLDYVLAILTTSAGVFLMYQNIWGHEQNLPHPQSTTTAAMLPFFVLVTVPILWRRRDILAVTGATAVALALHVVMFGWETRCGGILPVSGLLAYAVGRFAVGRREHLLCLGLVLLLQVVTLTRDSSIDTMISALPLFVPGAALLYGVGRLVQAVVNEKQTAAVAGNTVQAPSAAVAGNTVQAPSAVAA